MKKLLVVLVTMLAFTFQSNAQKLIVDEVDAFTGHHTKETNENTVFKRKSGGNLYLAAKSVSYEGDTSFYLKLDPSSDLGCVGARDNYVIFKFNDGSTERFDNDLANLDCGTYRSSIFLLGTESAIFKRSKQIVMIRLSQSEYYTTYDVIKGNATIGEIVDLVK